MKQILTTIATAILGTAVLPTVSNSFASNTNSSWNWENVGINHNVTTPSSGTHWIDDTKTSIVATANTWDNFMNDQTVIANGYFAAHTYDEPIFQSQHTLQLNTNVSTNTFREWNDTINNDKWAGWGHQTSTIKITLTATYNQTENLTALYVTSYVYARTAGSVHECSTTCQISTFEF